MGKFEYMYWNEIYSAIRTSPEEVLGPSKASFSPCTRRGSEFNSLLGQWLNLLHPNLSCRFCCNITTSTSRDSEISIHSSRQCYGAKKSLWIPRRVLRSNIDPGEEVIVRRYIRARISIWFIKTNNICDVCSSLDLRLYVAQEGGRTSSTPKHRDELKFREFCEGRRRLRPVIIIPCEIGGGRAPVGVIFGMFFVGDVNEASFRGCTLDYERAQESQKMGRPHFFCVLEVLARSKI